VDYYEFASEKWYTGCYCNAVCAGLQRFLQCDRRGADCGIELEGRGGLGIYKCKQVLWVEGCWGDCNVLCWWGVTGDYQHKGCFSHNRCLPPVLVRVFCVSV